MGFGDVRGGRDPMLLTQQIALLQQILNEQRVTNRLDADIRMLQAATFLQNNAAALDLMQILGFADLQFFDVSVTVAALATVTSFTLNVPANSVGFWRSLSITPDTSRVLTMQVLADGQQVISDLSLLPRTIIPESQWLPFSNTFVIRLTSTDAIGPHVINISGTRAFLQAPHWVQIRNRLTGAIQAIVGDQPYPSGVA